MLLLVKVADFVEGSPHFTNNLLIATGYAESKEPKKKEKGEHGAKKEDKKDDKGKQPEAIKVSETPPEKVVKIEMPEGPQFSAAEVEVLQRLRQRREQLDEREKSMEVREKVLRVTESKLDDKVAELNVLKKQVEDLLALYEAKEEMKLASLVTIYENMKPKEAARIFEELDMNILLPVIAKMKETKVAPVLAQMSPLKAKAVTTDLAQMRKLAPAMKPDVKAGLQN
jgi:flagellar motility protein MotE (MotC chaperone)